MIEEIEELYTEIENISDRIKHIEFIGNSDFNFEIGDDIDE